MIRTHQITANEWTQAKPGAGNFLRVVSQSGSTPIQIEYLKNHEVLEDSPNVGGVAAGYRAKPAPRPGTSGNAFEAFRLYSTEAQTVEIETLGGEAEVGSSNVVVTGDVTVNPVPDTFDLSRLYQNGVFSAASGGENIIQGIINPAGSGRVLKVYQVTPSAGGDSEGPIYLYTRQNSFLNTTYGFNVSYEPLGHHRPLNDYFTGSNNSMARFGEESFDAPFFMTTNTMIGIGMSSKTPNNKTLQMLDNRGPILIEPGYGLCVDYRATVASAALGLATTFLWEEIDQ